MPQHRALSGGWKQHSLGLHGWEGGNAKSRAMGPRKGAGVVVGVSPVNLEVEEGGRVALGGS